jgi:hypothetical protein
MLRHLPRKRAALAIAVAAALISSSEQRASAAVRDWTAASGNFNTPANWSGTLVPVAGDTARFVNAATYAVTFDINPTNAIAEVSAGAVTFRPDTVASRTYALSNLNLTGGSLTLADPTSGPNTLTLTATSLLNVANAALTLQGGNAISLAGILNVDAGGTLTVTGASSTLAQTSGSTNSVGAASGATALVSVTTSGVLSTGTGLLNINPTGTVSVNGGTGSFNGSISVDGGRLERLTSTGFNLAAGKGVAASNNGQIAFTGSYTINNTTAFTLNTGADLSTTSFLDVGRIGTGSLTIDGLGSSVTASSTSIWGSAGNIATVSIRNRATANFGSLNLANDVNAATVAYLRDPRRRHQHALGQPLYRQRRGRRRHRQRRQRQHDLHAHRRHEHHRRRQLRHGRRRAGDRPRRRLQRRNRNLHRQRHRRRRRQQRRDLQRQRKRQHQFQRRRHDHIQRRQLHHARRAHARGQ